MDQSQGRFTMYDAVDITNIPDHPTAVAGYVDGNWPTFHALVIRFPKAKHLSIAVTAEAKARCLDVETGDARPDEAPRWVGLQHARGIKRPIVYANTSTMPEVINFLEKDGIRRWEYLVWTSHYTGVEHIEPGSDATQRTDTAGFDTSLCESYFL